MAWDLAVIRPGDTPYGTRHMKMEAAPIPLHAEEPAGFTASRRNERESILADLVALVRVSHLIVNSLYTALSPDGNPEFSTVLNVLRALGLHLHRATTVNRTG